jgi:regulator of replication initiation timing
MASLDINPEEVIQNLSSQLGTLMSENTVLKMAIAKLQAALAEVEVLPDAVGSESEAEKKGK